MNATNIEADVCVVGAGFDVEVATREELHLPTRWHCSCRHPV
ncbi:hypothetical protein [Sorangium sp. So ce124]